MILPISTPDNTKIPVVVWVVKQWIPQNGAFSLRQIWGLLRWFRGKLKMSKEVST